MRKIIYKAAICLALIASLLFTFGTGALAQELPPEDNRYEGVENEENPRDVSDENPQADNTKTDEKNKNIDEKDQNVPDENSFSKIYNTVSENIDKIFSLCSFVCTLIIALIYKKNLLPGLKKTVASVGEALSSVKKESEKATAEAASQKDLLNKYCDSVSGLEDIYAQLNEKVGRLEDAKEERVFNLLLQEQIELLCDIFMSSSLPEYKKEEVGIRINKMREALENEKSVAE